jgi:hypothetical protein
MREASFGVQLHATTEMTRGHADEQDCSVTVKLPPPDVFLEVPLYPMSINARFA